MKKARGNRHAIHAFAILVPLLILLRRNEGAVLLTRIPSNIEAFPGKTVKFQWNYTVGDKNRDFGYYVSSPIWYYYDIYGNKTVIAADDGLNDWKWTIDHKTCPSRLLNPTIRVSRESVATLVISNVTTSDSGFYEICLVLRTSPSITDKVRLDVIGGSSASESDSTITFVFSLLLSVTITKL